MSINTTMRTSDDVATMAASSGNGDNPKQIFIQIQTLIVSQIHTHTHTNSMPSEKKLVWKPLTFKPILYFIESDQPNGKIAILWSESYELRAASCKCMFILAANCECDENSKRENKISRTVWCTPYGLAMLCQQ